MDFSKENENLSTAQTNVLTCTHHMVTWQREKNRPWHPASHEQLIYDMGNGLKSLIIVLTRRFTEKRQRTYSNVVNL